MKRSQQQQKKTENYEYNKGGDTFNEDKLQSKMQMQSLYCSDIGWTGWE